MTRMGWLRCVPAIVLAACASDPSDPGGGSGFRVTAAQPAAGSSGVPLGTTLEATLSVALDPASLVPGAVVVRRDGVEIPSVAEYDAGDRAIRIRAALLPGATYRAEIGSTLRSVGGEPLEPYAWSISTREWQPVRLGSVGQLMFYHAAIGPADRMHLFGHGEERPVSDYRGGYWKYA